MADWTQLPSDLLHLISERLHSRFDVVRFRSVCSTWRSVVTSPGLHRLAPSFLFIPADSGNWSKWSGYFFTLSKRTVFLIGSSKSKIQTEPSSSWIIKIEHVPDPKRIRFLNPLSKSPYDSLPYKFPKSFNSLDFRVLELGEEYMIDSYERKVVLSCSDYNVHDFVLLSISDYGDLAMFKSSDQRWTLIFQDTSPYYDDVVFYKENFYAVDIRGKILVVGLDSKISVVGEPIEDPSYDGRRKYLVESKGELFLIAMYWSLVRGRPRVFKLDEVSKEWIEVNNLNDRVLFIGNGCAFAATAEDLFLCRGNYIVFVNSIKPLLDVWDVRVVDLEDGSIRPLSKFPQLDKLFSPPYFGSSAKKGWKKQIAEKKKQITNKIAKLASAVTKGEQAAATRSWR